jgi:hypothetical protein
MRAKRYTLLHRADALGELWETIGNAGVREEVEGEKKVCK